MSEVKWIKLSTQMFEDEKIRLIESMPESDALLIIWIRLLSQAGKANAKGYILLNENIPYTDEMLATIFNRPLNTVRLALQTFQQFGMIDVDENQFISISNWEKHQNIDGLDKLREQGRKRVEKHRENKKKALPQPKNPSNRSSVTPSNVTCNVTVTESNATDIELELELEEELDKELDIKHQHHRESENHSEDFERNVKTDDDADRPGMVFRFYEQNIGLLVHHTIEKLNTMIDESTEELVQEALKRAIENNARNQLKYADSILLTWKKQNLKTLNDVLAADKAFERSKQTSKQHGSGNKPLREERLPEWFGKTEDEDSPAETTQSKEDLEAYKKEILAHLESKKKKSEVKS